MSHYCYHHHHHCTLTLSLLSLIIVNKKLYDNTYTVFGPDDHWVATKGFVSNSVILTKKDKSHCFAELQYVRPQRLAEDCTAQYQNSTTTITTTTTTTRVATTSTPSPTNGPMVQYCGTQILQRDKGRDRFQKDWNNTIK